MTSPNALYAAVWQTADDYLRDIMPAENYGDYILPFTVLRRLECDLKPSKPDVLAFLEENPSMPETLLDLQMRSKFGLTYYNTINLSLESIANSDDSVEEALGLYLDNFSSSITDIWDTFNFKNLISFLARNNRLWQVVDHFANIDLSEANVPDTTMGDLFENLMYRSFSRKGKDAGEFYTPRDAIRVMNTVLFATDDDSLFAHNAIRSIYDPTAGTGGMLILGKNHLEELNPDIEVAVYGQELKESSFALGKADLLMQGIDDPDAIKLGNTLTEDAYPDRQFDFIMSNPPYGGSWKAVQEQVLEIADQADSPFSHGTPPVSDGQMLFLSLVAHKLKPADGPTRGGRGAVVMNGSPLFTGDAGSGPDSIRRWLLEEDLVDVIVALPTEMFYNTGIATYIWFLDKNKEPRRRGKVQLIDATGTYTPMKKSLGNKRKEISDAQVVEIRDTYTAFEESDTSLILDIEQFGYRDVPMYRPERKRTVFDDDALAAAMNHKAAFVEHEDVIRKAFDVEDELAYNDLDKGLKDAAKAMGIKLTAPLKKHIMASMSVDDPQAPVSTDAKGKPVMDKSSKVVERIPLTEDVEEHMQREVAPFAPEMVWDENDSKVGYEIPITRLFYKPEETRTLEEIDESIANRIAWLGAKFKEVRE